MTVYALCLSSLPTKHIATIAEYLPPRDLIRFGRACRAFNRLVDAASVVRAFQVHHGPDAPQVAFEFGMRSLDTFETFLRLNKCNNAAVDTFAYVSGMHNAMDRLKRCTPSITDSFCRGLAAGGHVKALQTYFVMLMFRGDVEYDVGLLNEAAKHGQTAVISLLFYELDDMIDQNDVEHALDRAAMGGHVDAFAKLLEHAEEMGMERACKGTCNGFLLAALAKRKQNKLFAQCLRKYPAEGFECSEIFTAAASVNNMTVMRMLEPIVRVEDNEDDEDDADVPPVELFEALAAAVENDHRKAFDYMLKTFNVDSTSAAYAMAVLHRRQEYLDVLLPIAKASCFAHALDQLAEAGRLDDLKQQLELFRSRHTDVGYALFQAVAAAARGGHWDVMTFLAAQPEIFSAFTYQSLLTTTVMAGHPRVVAKLLLNKLGSKFVVNVEESLGEIRSSRFVEYTAPVVSCLLVILLKHPNLVNNRCRIRSDRSVIDWPSVEPCFGYSLSRAARIAALEGFGLSPDQFASFRNSIQQRF